MPPVTSDDNPFTQPGADDLPQPTIGGCWLRQPDGSLVPDPSEPPPPGLPAEAQPD